MANMRDTVEHFMRPRDEDELESFARWAFGDNFHELDHSLKFMESWNEIHGDDFLLRQDGIIEHDVPKMIQMWRDEKED